MYTVKQLADLAGVSVRTLHYYDEIGLLTPPEVGANGYRYYDDESLLTLQQILFFREMDLSLSDIGKIVGAAGFDVLAALDAHREGIEARIRRLNRLIDTIDETMKYLRGNGTMSDKRKLFGGFTPEEEKQYAEEARERWGSSVDESYKLWNSYSDAKKQQVMAEGQAIYADMVSVIDQPADSDAVQSIIARWHQHMRYFYEPSVERLRGLGQHYVDDPRFAAMHPDLAEGMRRAIYVYCDRLEAE